MVADPVVGCLRLTAHVDFDDARSLQRALGRVDGLLATHRPRAAHVLVRHRPETLTEPIAAVHAAWAAAAPAHVRVPRPLCFPGLDTRPFATPEDCAGCILHARGCQGLDGTAEPTGGLTTQPPPGAPPTWTRAAFAAEQPFAYWLPTRAIIGRFVAAVGATGRDTVWDLGGGSGWLGALLAAEGLRVTLIDTEARTDTPPGVGRRVADARSLCGPPPAAVVVSWPPPGHGFRETLERLRPAVVLQAFDADGSVGRRRGHLVCQVDAEAVRVEGSAVDDFDPLPGYAVHGPWPTWTHADLRRGAGAPGGWAQIQTLGATLPAASGPPYPWEPDRTRSNPP